MNETDLARAIAAGLVPSPAVCGGFLLYALRFTGTGTVWREAQQELAYRAPGNYLSPEFLQRVPGLPVVANHPEGAALDGEEFDARVIGTCGYAYIAGPDGIENPDGDEVWTICRIYSQDAVDALTAQQLSTSPAVIWHKGDVGERVDTSNGSQILIENAPVILDHLAVCALGVFDKGGPPMGVRCDSEKGKAMTEEEKKAAEAAAADKARCDAEEKEKVRERRDAELSSNIDKVLQHLDDVAKRLGVLEAASKPTNPPSRTWQIPTAQDEKEQREEYAKMADARARADSVYLAHGLRSPAPHAYETLPAYRVRLARGLQQHCKTFAKADIGALVADQAAFDAVENVIYQDALVASRTPDVPDGRMVKRVRTLESGHNVTEWFGRTTIFKAFAPPSQRAVRFNTPEAGRR
jgi:hypothetical protein